MFKSMIRTERRLFKHQAVEFYSTIPNYNFLCLDLTASIIENFNICILIIYFGFLYRVYNWL